MPLFEIAGLPLSFVGEWSARGALLQQFRAYRCDDPGERPILVSFRPGQAAPSDAPVTLARAGAFVSVWPAKGLIEIGGTGEDAPVERLLMHGFAAVAAARGVLLLHAAAVEGAAGGIAFLGPSGAGKTTAALNCRPARLIHQDRVAVGVGPRGPWLAPVPFLYDEPRSGATVPGPFARMVVVRKGSANLLSPVEQRDRARILCASVLMPADPALGVMVLESVRAVSGAVPMHFLDARRDGGFWPLLMAAQDSSHPAQAEGP